MNKIVVLDAFSTNPGDLSWDSFKEIGDLTLYDRTPLTKTVEHCRGANIVFSNKAVINAEAMKQLPDSKFIGVLASGYNNIDIEMARELNIMVCNVPGYSGQSVAQQIMAMILENANKISEHSTSVRKGDWSRCPDFTYTVGSITELAGKTLGIYGYGDIGSRLANMARSFDMNVIIYKRSKPDSLPEGVTYVSSDEIFEKSDYISLNCPLTESTQHLINSTTLSKMKSSAVLINTGRGPLINEKDLAEALKSKTIAGAYLDVLSAEPPPIDHPLLGAPNCKITPHIAWSTPEARKRLLDISINNLKAFLNSSPVNSVV